MKESFHSVINTDFEALKKLTAAVDEFLQAMELPGEPVYRIELALEEMVTNVIKYGYDSPGRNLVEIDLQVAPNNLTLTIIDTGHAFNPLQAVAPDLQEDVATRPVGGVGIHLTRKLSSNMTYQRLDDKNILTVEVNMQISP